MYLNSFLEAVQNRINNAPAPYDGFTNSFILDSLTKFGEASVIYSIEDLTVYEITVIDYKRDVAYRYVNPDFKGHEFNGTELEYDETDSFDDIIEKVHAILNNRRYNFDTIITLELPKEVIEILTNKAYDLDMNLDDYINELLLEEIERIESY
jgi:predicted HicB family RNase H-like nuclease